MFERLIKKAKMYSDKFNDWLYKYMRSLQDEGIIIAANQVKKTGKFISTEDLLSYVTFLIEINNNIKHNIKRYAKEHDLYLKDIAEKIDIKYKDLRKTETTWFTMDQFLKFCNEYNVYPYQVLLRHNDVFEKSYKEYGPLDMTLTELLVKMKDSNKAYIPFLVEVFNIHF